MYVLSLMYMYKYGSRGSMRLPSMLSCSVKIILDFCVIVKRFYKNDTLCLIILKVFNDLVVMFGHRFFLLCVE